MCATVIILSDVGGHAPTHVNVTGCNFVVVMIDLEKNNYKQQESNVKSPSVSSFFLSSDNCEKAITNDCTKTSVFITKIQNRTYFDLE